MFSSVSLSFSSTQDQLVLIQLKIGQSKRWNVKDERIKEEQKSFVLFNSILLQ